MLEKFENDPLFILIGNHSQRYYLKDDKTLTQRLQNIREYLPKYFLLPHPSPVNHFWINKNPWFLEENIPVLRKIIAEKLRK